MPDMGSAGFVGVGASVSFVTSKRVGARVGASLTFIVGQFLRKQQQYVVKVVVLAYCLIRMGRDGREKIHCILDTHVLIPQKPQHYWGVMPSDTAKRKTKNRNRPRFSVSCRFLSPHKTKRHTELLPYPATPVAAYFV